MSEEQTYPGLHFQSHFHQTENKPIQNASYLITGIFLAPIWGQISAPIFSNSEKLRKSIDKFLTEKCYD